MGSLLGVGCKVGLPRSFWGFLFGLIWTLGVLFGVPFGPGVLLWGPFWALGPNVGSPECTGKGTDAQSGCQEAFGRPPGFKSA